MTPWESNDGRGRHLPMCLLRQTIPHFNDAGDNLHPRSNNGLLVLSGRTMRSSRGERSASERGTHVGAQDFKGTVNGYELR